MYDGYRVLASSDMFIYHTQYIMSMYTVNRSVMLRISSFQHVVVVSKPESHVY